MKRILIVVVGLLVLAGVAALVGPSFVDWNRYKAEIAGPIEQATGRRLAMNGDLSLAVLPSPRVSAADVRLSDLEGKEDFVRLRSLEVEVALWPLLRGEIQVVSIRLVDPEVFLEVAADGSPNWTMPPTGDEAGAPVNGASAGTPSNISVERVVIANGTVDYVDAVSGQRRRIEAITATLTADNLAQGPFAAEGRFTVNGQPVGFDVALGSLATGGPVPVRAKAELERGGALASLQGTLTSLERAPALEAKISFEGSDLREALSIVARALDVELPLVVPGAQSFSVAAQVAGDGRQASLNDLAIQVGDTRATGAVSASLVQPLSIDVTLALGRVDLDAWANAVAVESRNGGPEASPAGPASAAANNSLEAIAGINANLTLTGDALTYRGSVVRQVRIAANIAEGALTIGGLSAMLPGGSDVSLTGRLATVDGQPRFDGNVEAASADFRGLAAWLGMPLEGIAPDRLRQLSLQSRIRATRELGQVYGLDLRVDTSRITGGAAYAFRSRPSFSVDLEIDRLNVDAYLPPAAPNGTPTQITDRDPVDRSGPASFAFLERFDTNARLAVDSLTFDGRQLGKVRVDATLLAGDLTIRQAAIGDAGGAAVMLTGSAGSFASVPAFDTKVSIKARDAAAPARYFGVDLPVDAKALGAVDIDGSVIGTAEDLALDIKAKIGDMTAGLAGRAELLAVSPRFDMKADLQAPSFVRAAGLAGMTIAPVERGLDGALSVVANIRGTEESVTLDTAIRAADLALVVGGAISDPTGAPSYNLSLQVNHPDLERLIRMFGATYRPAAVNLGLVRALADITGSPTQLRASRLEGQLGPVNFVGDAVLTLGGARPVIDALLNTSEILVDLFLARPDGASGQGRTGGNASQVAAGGERWSQEPIDLSALQGIDGILELRARGLTYGAYALREPVLIAKLDNGTLTVDPFSANLFGGAAALRMSAVADRRARIGVSLDLDGANIEDALKTSAGLDRVTGLFNMTGEVSTTGQSQFDLVRNLNGTLSFAARDGELRGLDLPALSARLGELNRGLDFADLLLRAFEGGSTDYQSFSGSFQIENGVARSNDLMASLDAAAGTGTALIDLPRWRLDMSTRARLTDHPKSPDIGLDLTGPIDNPQRNVRTQALEQYIAERVGTTLIRKFLKDDDSAPTTNEPAASPSQDGRIPSLPGQTQEQETAPASGNDVLRGLIRRLGR